MNPEREKQRRTRRSEAVRALEEWALVTLDHIKSAASELVGSDAHLLVVFHAKLSVDPDALEERDELREVVVSTPQGNTLLGPGSAHPEAWSEMVSCWDELRSALSYQYCETAPPSLVLDLEASSFLAYDVEHCDGCGPDPSMVGDLSRTEVDLDPYADLLVDLEAESDELIEDLIGKLGARGLELPTTHVEEH